MQFNELKATVMDYIWLIRDSLSANNAIYFQFTIFVFSVKPGIFLQMMKDSSQQFVCPCRYLWYADFFRGWTMNSSWLLFHFQLCHIPEGLITSRGWAPAALLLCHGAAGGTDPFPGQEVPSSTWRGRGRPSLELLRDVWGSGEQVPRRTVPSSSLRALHPPPQQHPHLGRPPAPLPQPLANMHRYVGLPPPARAAGRKINNLNIFPCRKKFGGFEAS